MMLCFADMSIKSRLYSQIAVAVIGFIAVLSITLWLSAAYQVNGPLYDRLVVRRAALSEVEPSVLTLVMAKLSINHMLLARDEVEARRFVEEYRKCEKVFRDRQAHWRKELFDGPVKKALENDVYPPAEEFFQIANAELLPLVLKGDKAAAIQLTISRMRPLFDQHMIAVYRAVEVGNERNHLEEANIRQEIDTGNRIILLIGLGTVAIVGLMGWYISRNIARSAELLRARVVEMATGASDLTARVPIERNDELGQLGQGINA